MLNIPSPRPLPGRVHAVSFVVVGDDACLLRNNLMKPYPLRNISSEQRVFIYFTAAVAEWLARRTR